MPIHRFPSAITLAAILVAALGGHAGPVHATTLAQSAAPPQVGPAPAITPAPPQKPAVEGPVPTARPADAATSTPAPAPPEKPAAAEAPVPPTAAGTEPAATEPDPDMQKVADCKVQALARLKQASPSIDDIFIDVDGLTIAEANSKLGDTEVKGVMMGEAYIQRDRSDRANRFLCLTGADGKVLFTFFTER
ncbi:hypothetical protein [Ancylobacter lacus]|uniref:hypothetical protein n=1 Tax=Ancylobacter lacus TaxID=2579970 RepID=UPI001FEC2B09|nr:hypothetical protein [Ancylobacter lacus]